MIKRIGIVALLLSTFSYAQQPLNLEFEQVDLETNLPVKWEVSGDNYQIKVDRDAREGNSSLLIQSNNDKATYGKAVYRIPTGYDGQKIVLSGFIKSKDVSGKAGIGYTLLRRNRMITSPSSSMANNVVEGTTEWTKYSLELDLHPKTDAIEIEVALMGQGQVWFDNLEIHIDGKNINDLEPKALPKAELDKEFDNGSNFKVNSLNAKEIRNLVELGKAWGKLKYTNPKIRDGEYNWDYELFRILPIIHDAKFDKKLNEWKLSYGEEQQSIPEYHYYVDFYRDSNAFLINEKTYENIGYDDQGYRLLTLFRYWNAVEYFFAYKDLLKRDWTEVLEEFIPKFLFAKDELAYKLEIIKMAVELHDSHSMFFDQKDTVIKNSVGVNRAPVRVAFIDEKLVVSEIFEGLSSKSNIKVGDEILEINGKKLKDVIEKEIQYVPGSNRSYRLADITYTILLTNNTVLPLVLKGDQGVYLEQVNTVNRSSVNLFEQSDYKGIEEFDGDIGYINLSELVEKDLEVLKSKFINKKGIIMDLRGYASVEYLDKKLLPYFLPDTRPFVKFTSPNTNEIGTFKEGKNMYVGVDNSDYFKGKVAVLVNYKTISHSEFLAMAFQTLPNVRTFGTQTAGADGNVVIVDMPKGFRMYFSGLGTFYPDGRQTQQIGIQIDEIVKPTIKSIKERKDVVLDRALEYLRQ